MKIIQGIEKEPFLGIIHGEVGSGKTHFGTTFPDPVFITGERLKNIKSKRLPQISKWNDLENALTYALKLDCETIVIDTLDSFELILQRDILVSEKRPCGMNKAMGGYGNSRDYILRKFISIKERYFEKILERGVNLVLLSQTIVDTVEDPLGGASERYYILKLHRSSKGQGLATMLMEWVDNIFMLKNVSRDKRVLYTVNQPNIEAKNRYKIPDGVIIADGDGWNMIEPFIKKFYREDEEDIKDLKNKIEIHAEGLKDKETYKKIMDAVDKCNDLDQLNRYMDRVEELVNGCGK